MYFLSETLNLWGARFSEFAWPLFVQTSAVIVVLLLLDFALRRHVRAVIRYGLLLLMLVKLVLPPALASPTSLAYWLRPAKPAPVKQAPASVVVARFTEANTLSMDALQAMFTGQPIELPRPTLSREGWLALAWIVVGLSLTGFLLWRLRSMSRRIHHAVVPPEGLSRLLADSSEHVRLPRRIRLLICNDAASPAVCGLYRPVILIPRRLVERLNESQLRTVLLHELAHIKRGDVWVNCAQVLLQIIYWWHPLVWIANARIRRVREEAVDEAVQVALGRDADIYPPTLIEVARSIVGRPRLSLGLVGIAEPKSALSHRIQRMLDRPVPRSAKLNASAYAAILACAALLLPMARGQQRAEAPAQTTPQSSSPAMVSVKFDCVEVSEADALAIWESGSDKTLAPAATWAAWLTEPQIKNLKSNSAVRVVSGPSVTTLSGRQAQILADTSDDILAGAATNNIEGAILRTALDVIPTVESNVTVIALDVTAAVGRFAGFEDSGARLPRIDSLTLKANTRVWAGQTLLLGNPLDSANQAVEVPGDGRKRLLVLITALVIDAAGNRVNPDRPSAPTETNASRTVVPAPYPIRNVAGPEIVDVASLVQDGVLLYEMGKLDEAEARFKQALEANPESRAAAHYSNLILAVRRSDRRREREQESTRMFVEMVETLQRPGTVAPNANRQRILSKLDSIRLDEVSYDGLPLREVMRDLSNKARERDPDRRGVNFIVTPFVEPQTTTLPGTINPNTGLLQPTLAPPVEPVDMNEIAIKLVPALSNVRLADVLDAVVKVAEPPIKYSIEDYAIVFSQRNAREIPPLYTRNFKLDHSTFYHGLARIGAISQSTADVLSSPQIRNEGGGLNPGVARNEFREFTDAFLGVFTNAGVEFSPPRSLYLNGSGRLLVRASLQELDIVENLIQRLSSGETTNVFPGTVPTPGTTPNTPLPQTRTSPDVGTPNQPAAPSTNDSLKLSRPRSLYESPPRELSPGYKVQQVCIIRVLEDGSYLLGTKRMDLAALRDHLSEHKRSTSELAVHVQAATNAPFSALVALTDLCKEMGVSHVTASTLPTIPAGGQAANTVEEKLYTRFYKVDPNNFIQGLDSVGALAPDSTETNRVYLAIQKSLSAAGVDFAPPKSVFFNDRQGRLLVRATLEDLDTIEAAIQMLNTSPPMVNIEVRFVELSQEDSRALGLHWYLGSPPTIINSFPASSPTLPLSSGFVSAASTNPAVASFTGILTEPQSKVVLRALEQRGGVDFVAEPTVTTLSGRQAQIQSVNMQAIMRGTNAQTVPLGPMIDVIPYVAADGYTIQMTLVPSITEFLGYDDPGSFTIIPRLRVRQVVTSANVWDGQTVVLGGLVPEEPPTKGKPGRKKNLLIFVTPTIIDPAGNRVHTDSDLPSGRNSVPPQSPR